MAPAGYGKTTALALWLSRAAGARAWLSLDELDNDPHRLSAHLLAALDQTLPGAMADAQRALAGGSDHHDTAGPSSRIRPPARCWRRCVARTSS